jgi:hypothetical protein
LSVFLLNSTTHELKSPRLSPVAVRFPTQTNNATNNIRLHSTARAVRKKQDNYVYFSSNFANKKIGEIQNREIRCRFFFSLTKKSRRVTQRQFQI